MTYARYAHFVVVTRPEIDHDMLVTAFSSVDWFQLVAAENIPVEEHEGARVVQLVHLKCRLARFKTICVEDLPC